MEENVMIGPLKGYQRNIMPFHWSKSKFGRTGNVDRLEEFYLVKNEEEMLVRYSQLDEREKVSHMNKLIPRELGEMMLAYVKPYPRKDSEMSPAEKEQCRLQAFIDEMEKTPNPYLQKILKANAIYQNLRSLPVFIETISNQLSCIVDLIANCDLNMAQKAMYITVQRMERLILDLRADYEGNLQENRQTPSKELGTWSKCNIDYCVREIYCEVEKKRKNWVKTLKDDNATVQLWIPKERYPILYEYLQNGPMKENIEAEEEYLRYLADNCVETCETKAAEEYELFFDSMHEKKALQIVKEEVVTKLCRNACYTNGSMPYIALTPVQEILTSERFSSYEQRVYFTSFKEVVACAQEITNYMQQLYHNMTAGEWLHEIDGSDELQYVHLRDEIKHSSSYDIIVKQIGSKPNERLVHTVYSQIIYMMFDGFVRCIADIFRKTMDEYDNSPLYYVGSRIALLDQKRQRKILEDKSVQGNKFDLEFGYALEKALYAAFRAYTDQPREDE